METENANNYLLAVGKKIEMCHYKCGSLIFENVLILF